MGLRCLHPPRARRPCTTCSVRWVLRRGCRAFVSGLFSWVLRGGAVEWGAAAAAIEMGGVVPFCCRRCNVPLVLLLLPLLLLALPG